MKYLENTLYIEPEYKPWPFTGSLPLFIQSTFTFKYVTINKTSMIFVYYKPNNPISASIKKHLTIIEQKAALPVVLILDKATYREREFLIKNKIPFIVKNRQIFLPFLGYVLQENFTAAKDEANISRFTPTAQKLLFFIIYNQIKYSHNTFIASHIGKEIGIQPMGISRATNQLHDLHLIDIEIKGTSKHLFPKASKAELLDMAAPYIITPIKKKVTMLFTKDTNYKPIVSGETALSEYTNLNPPVKPCWGLVKTQKTPDIFALNIQNLDYPADFEYWAYDPTIINDNREIADPLSLYATFKNNNDERIQSALIEMLHNLWKGRYTNA